MLQRSTLISVNSTKISKSFPPGTTAQPSFNSAKSTIEIPEERVKICSKLTIKTQERHFLTFEQISHIALVFPLLRLNGKSLKLVYKREVYL